jgi:phage anti-repressor protein
MQKQFIPVTSTIINNESIPTVNARELHVFLEVSKDFSSWMKVQSERARLIENQDFVVFTQKGENPQGGRSSIEYHLTIEAGKSIGMMSATDKGFQIRDYFIECERQAKQKAIPTGNLALAEVMLLAMKEQEVRLVQVESSVTELKSNLKLENWQQSRLLRCAQNKVDEWLISGEVLIPFKKTAFQHIWRSVKNKFEIPRYNELPALKFDEALKFIIALPCPR